MAWIPFGALHYRKRNLKTARVPMLLKSLASLICFELVSFLVGLRTYQHPSRRVRLRVEKKHRVFLIASCWLVNPRRSLNASGQRIFRLNCTYGLQHSLTLTVTIPTYIQHTMEGVIGSTWTVMIPWPGGCWTAVVFWEGKQFGCLDGRDIDPAGFLGHYQG